MRGPDLQSPIEPGSPSQRRSSFSTSLAIFVAGALWVLYTFKSHGWHSGVDISAMWKQFSSMTRLGVVAGFIANAWGLGGMVDSILRQRSER